MFEWACSADPKPGLIRFFFHPEQYFSLTDSAGNSKIQPLQCFFYCQPNQPIEMSGALHICSHQSCTSKSPGPLDTVNSSSAFASKSYS